MLSIIPISNKSNTNYDFLEKGSPHNRPLEYEKEMRVGLRLSDGSYVIKYIESSTYFKFAGSEKFTSFILHIHSIMYEAGYVNMKKKTGISIVKGKV